MELADLQAAIPGFIDKGHPEKIKILAWYLHAHKNLTSFPPADIRRCYDGLHFLLPSSFSGYFKNLDSSKEFLKHASRYRLSARPRAALDALYAEKGHTVMITALLATLPAQIPDLAERTYLDEALICYKHGAFRAAIVITLNLPYHHLCDFILQEKLAEFNARWLISFPGQHRKRNLAIANMHDFGAELKESQVLTIAKDGGIISSDVYKILDEKLGKRNSAAHPSGVNIGQLQTDAFIDDLVKNVVLKLR
ncbi:MAG: hypothetical protein QOJ99_3175 [Bryobacterales bacterium]|jgi:hypothetical protein|nr:hypothetical protein [Bryobacterales bacterium]